MITEIQIASYKGIGPNPLSLSEFVSINYFVGENGSGKTSVLRYIFEQNRSSALWLADGITELDHLQEFDWNKALGEKSRDYIKKLFTESILKYQYVSLDLLAYALHNTTKNAHYPVISEEVMVESLDFAKKIALIDEEFILNNQRQIADQDGESLNSGQQKFVNIIYCVLWAYKQLGTTIFALDGIDGSLHPSLQKKIPTLLEAITQEVPVQFFVSTHSPFVISAVGQLSTEEPIQKVYFLKGGKSASKRGLASTKGSSGYYGNKVTEISSRMLGAGLMDLISYQEPARSHMTPLLVLCEGEGLNNDASVYNTLFRNHTPSVMFVSGRGSSQLLKSFRILSSIKPSLSLDIKIKMLRDRDHEFPTESSIRLFEEKNKDTKILRRRAIEHYFFNPDTAKTVLSLFNKKILKRDVILYSEIEERIKYEIEHEVPGNDYKQLLEEWFLNATRGFMKDLQKASGLPLMEQVASLLYPGHPIYAELESIIFEPMETDQVPVDDHK